MSAPVDRTRRRWLLGAAAGGALALLGAGTAQHARVAAWTSKRWVERVIREHLPGVEIDTASLEHFVIEAVHGHARLRTTALQAGAAWRHVRGILGLPVAADQAWLQLERELVSRFLTGSNFFRVEDPRRETIVYGGQPAACGNIFARFRDD